MHIVKSGTHLWETPHSWHFFCPVVVVMESFRQKSYIAVNPDPAGSYRLVLTRIVLAALTWDKQADKKYCYHVVKYTPHV